MLSLLLYRFLFPFRFLFRFRFLFLFLFPFLFRIPDSRFSRRPNKRPLLLIQSVTLLKPAGYFNFYWNPYMRYLFFASVWLHDYFILCQNRIFGINDPKPCPRLNTAKVTFVTYHCKDLKRSHLRWFISCPKENQLPGSAFLYSYTKQRKQ